VTALGQPAIDAAIADRTAPDARTMPWTGLADAALRDGIPLPDGDHRRMLRFRDLLLDWNTRFNLTAISDPDAVERVLLLDAVRMTPALDAAIGATGLRHPSLVDIGSGGGLPAIPLAILRPDLDVTMIEATGKKAGFLRAAIDGLGLSNARALHGRAEELARDPAHRARYDLASARAVASLPALVELSLPFLRTGGVALFPKGLGVDGEIAAARIALREVGGELAGDVLLPGGETRLVSIRKSGPTPDRYPRRSGLPSREPLGARAGGQRR